MATDKPLTLPPATPAAPLEEPQAGGSYTRDPATGALVRTGGTEPAPQQDKRGAA